MSLLELLIAAKNDEMVGKKSQRKIKFQALLYKQKQIIDCADEVENS